MKKKIVILGSTGSIGTQTIKLLKKDKDNFSIKLLSTNTNIKKLYNQAKLFNVKHLIITDLESYKKAKNIYKDTNIKFYNSFTIIDKLFKKKEIYYSMISIVGLDGLYPILKIIKFTRNIAIINKESLICGWNLILKKLNLFKTRFFPLDSEHFSIFFLLNGLKSEDIEKIFITASGGPFLNYSKLKLSKIKINDALNHPNWKMGKKISIDSSTMMNKLFEVIEAKKIFNISYNKINILIHPKSYVHAIVKFNNGVTKFLSHEPEMKIPIHNSIYNDEIKKIKSKEINLNIFNNLNFQRVDNNKFPLIKILKILPNHDSLFETVLVTVNDFFVTLYLKNKISYKKLIQYINLYSHNQIFNNFKKITPKSLHEIYKTRDYVNEKLSKLCI